VKFTAPVIRVRCTGLPGFSPRLLDLAVVILGTLGIFPIFTALRLSGTTATVIPVSLSRYLLPSFSPSPGKMLAQAPGEACEDLATGIERLKAEFSVSYLTPQSGRDVSNLHVLTDVQNDRELLPETIALAARVQAMIKDYFELNLSDPQNSEIRKSMIISSLDSLLGDLLTAVRRDCRVASTSRLAPRTVR